MPKGDGTGPMGMGAMTGRAAGFCAYYGMPGYSNPSRSRGFGGHGGCHGGRRRFYETGLPGWMRLSGYAAPDQKPDPEMEKQALKNQTDALQSEMDLIKKRLSEIEAGNAAQ